MKKDFYGYKIHSDGKIENKHGRFLIPRIREKRSDIRLVVEGKRKNFTTARLVYCVFNNIDIFQLDKDQCITFKDGDKSNVSLDNLEMVYRGNLIQGDKHRSIAKLSKEEVEDIKRKYEATKHNRPVNQHDIGDKTYNSYRSLAKEYGVTYPLIRQIITGETRDKEAYKLKNKID